MKTRIYLPSKWPKLSGEIQTEVSGSIEQEIDLMQHTLQELKELNLKLSQMNTEIKLFISNRKTYQNKEM